MLFIFRNLAVPVKLSNFQIQLQYLVIVYFNFAVIYDIVVWSLELSGKMEPWSLIPNKIILLCHFV